MKIVTSLLVAFLVAFSGGKSVDTDRDQIDPRQARVTLTSDFEDGSMSPWYDQSPARVNWNIEDLNSPFETGNPAPVPNSGFKYLRATRNADLQSGLAVLRSPVFTAEPGDRIQFSFWIRSRQPQGNNLELYWVNGTREELLLGLSDFSSITNNEWRRTTVNLPLSTAADISLVFYGFCGSNSEDAIAIDDISYGPGNTTSTSAPSTTSSLSSTAGFTTTSTIDSTTPPLPLNCDLKLLDSVGNFTSPNYPNNYPNNLKCSWLIVARYANRIQLSFNTFLTEYGYDFVTVYDGSSISSPVLVRATGSDYVPPVSSSRNVMLVDLVTDYSTGAMGFSASYETIYPTTTTGTTSGTVTPSPGYCGQTLTGWPGTLSSPNYPYNYIGGVRCTILIRVSTGYRIRLDFTDFSTYSTGDAVTLYDGGDLSFPIIGVYSGNTIPSPVISSSNELYLTFVTDEFAASRGWHATYTGF